MRIIKKYIAVFMAFAMTLGVCLLFGMRKTGMFIDEIYSYGLSNSEYAPFLSDLKGGQLTDQIFTREEIDGYLTVIPGEGFDFASVYYNQERDVHPPLYYWLFHTVSSCLPGSASKWIGLGINIAFYMLTLFVLMVCMAVCFVKQHSSIDVLAALPVCLLAEGLVYGKDYWLPRWRHQILRVRRKIA